MNTVQTTPTPEPIDVSAMLYRALATYVGRRNDVLPYHSRIFWAFAEFSDELNIDDVCRAMHTRIAERLGVPGAEVVLSVSNIQSAHELQERGTSAVPAHRWLENNWAGSITYIPPAHTVLLLEGRTLELFGQMHAGLMAEQVARNVLWRGAFIHGVTPWLVFVGAACTAPGADADAVAAALPALLAGPLEVDACEISVIAVQEMTLAQQESQRADASGIAYAWEAFEPPHELWPNARTIYSLVPPDIADYMSNVRDELDGEVPA